MHSFFDYYQHFIMSKLLLFLLGLLMVVTRGRECESNYTGFYSDLEVANCTNSQIRTHKGEYQICISSGDWSFWAFVCGSINLCLATNSICPNCNFACSSSIFCSEYSSGCISGNNTSYCDIVNGANILTSLISFVTFVSLIPILV